METSAWIETSFQWADESFETALANSDFDYYTKFRSLNRQDYVNIPALSDTMTKK